MSHEQYGKQQKRSIGVRADFSDLCWIFFAKNKSFNSDSNPTGISSNANFDLTMHKSEGERLLITSDSNPDKEAAIAAIAKKDYATATAKWEASLSKQRNDPEALIYLKQCQNW